MTWKPWSHGELKWTRERTAMLRSSNEDYFPRLREALASRSIDPSKSVLVELFPDGGSDYGVVLGPDGTVYQIDVWWGSDKIEVNEKSPEWPSHGQQICAGRELLAEEGSIVLDPLEALLPGIRDITVKFRTGQLLDMDWSLAREAIAGEGMDPGRVVLVTAAYGSSGLKATFVFPDTRVFRFTAALDDSRSGSATRTLEWVEMADHSEIADYYGKLHEAALRVLREEESSKK